jgi:hypothetical protein
MKQEYNNLPELRALALRVVSESSNPVLRKDAQRFLRQTKGKETKQ